jgi:hypothetical protein
MSPFEKTAEEDEILTPEEIAAIESAASMESFPIEELIPEYGDA